MNREGLKQIIRKELLEQVYRDVDLSHGPPESYTEVVSDGLVDACNTLQSVVKDMSSGLVQDEHLDKLEMARGQIDRMLTLLYKNIQQETESEKEIDWGT